MLMLALDYSKSQSLESIKSLPRSQMRLKACNNEKLANPLVSVVPDIYRNINKLLISTDHRDQIFLRRKVNVQLNLQKRDKKTKQKKQTNSQ